jgi:subfamily B ATP-binding cassette protein MsbA
MDSIQMDCHNDMTFAKMMGGFIDKHKWLMLGYFLLMLTNPIRDILAPHIVGKVYTGINKNKSVGVYLGILLVIIIVVQVMAVGSDYIETKLHPMIHKYVREMMMTHIFKTRENHYSDVEVGDVITKIIKLPSILFNFVDTMKWLLIPSSLTLLGSIVYMFFIDWKLALPLLAIIGVFVYMLYDSMYTCSIPAVKRDENFSALFSNVDDVLRNMITVLSFDKINHEFDRLDEWQKEYAKYTEETLNCSLRAKYVVIPLMLTFVIGLSYYCYTQIKGKKMESGTFVSLLIISFVITNIMLSILGSWKDFIMRWGIIEHSLKSFDSCDVVNQPYDGVAREATGIYFQNVDFTYVSTDQQRAVFRDFNLHIRPKEVTLIMGEIGSGKSTILNLLLKYQVPQAGEIFMNGSAYSTLNNTDVRRRIGYIPQTPVLMNRSIYENIVYGLQEEPSKEVVETLMRDLGLGQFLDKLPQGLDTSVGVHGSKLSGGQRQITWVLKAILMNPEIIIMDEPTSAVDEETKGVLHYLLENVMEGKTVIMITHDKYLLKFADRVITMKSGVIVSDERA